MPDINFEVDNTSLSVVSNAIINANFDEVKAGLEEMLAPYKGVIVSADSVSSAKAERAKINKIQKSIDDFRKTVKKVASKPITDFEERCKELTSTCKAAADNLDTQIKAFEETAKQEKIDELKSYFESKTIKYPEYICFNDIVNPAWGNKTFDIEQARYEIDMAIQQSDTSVSTILSLNNSHVSELLSLYKLTRNIYEVLAKNEKLLETDRWIEQKRAAESSRTAPVPAPVEEVEDGIEELEEIPHDNIECLYVVGFRVTATQKELDAISSFLNRRGISWEAI